MTLLPMTTSDDIETLSIREVFDDYRYRIPIYQRAYAWSTAEIHTLLRDIRDARLNNSAANTDSDYYLGSLVVNALHHYDETIYEVIDGQQRLTTLFIVLSVAPRILVSDDEIDWSDKLRDALQFEGRERSQEDLKRLSRDGAESLGLLETAGIAHAAELIQAAAIRGRTSNHDATVQESEALFEAEDFEYLLRRVKIVRTKLPKNTDLNHYFEVMNTRGEQLEKHEILKARLLGKLQPDDDQADSDKLAKDRATLSRIWDACSQLHRHIQIQFKPKNERTKIFGKDWDTFVPQDSVELFNIFKDNNTSEDAHSDNSPQSLFELVNSTSPHTDAGTETEDDETGSYGSIIDFPNLLLHVLKIKQDEEFSWSESDPHPADEIRLEDKYLLEEFDKVLQLEGADWVREFTWLLLRVRYLMDTYVIRTQPDLAGNDAENWVIHRTEKYEPKEGKSGIHLSQRNTFGMDSDSGDEEDQSAAGRRVLMLQTMFQVTDVRRASKYYLFQMLQWLNDNEQNRPVSPTALAHFLELSAQQRLTALRIGDKLDKGRQVSNFIFNFLDYVLWLRDTDKHHPFTQCVAESEVDNVIIEHARNFRFRYRTSVEHFYPVTPDESQRHETLPSDIVDQFGNLCIMSRSENSARNNLMPLAKITQYRSEDQSLKFQIMAQLTKNLESTEHPWHETQIKSHGKHMREILEGVLQAELPAADQENQE